jgi:hypothetical protein
MATRLRPLSEAEAYARCYAGASDEVRVVKIPRRPRYQLEVSGEDLRAAFADRLDKREPELDPDLVATEDESAAKDEPIAEDEPVAQAAATDASPAAEEAA